MNRARTANKFNAVPVVIDGIRFASGLEGQRYRMLKLMERAGEIHGFQLQVRFPLMVGAVKIATYIADFVYLKAGQRVIEDAKGKQTPVFRRSAAHMAAQGDAITLWPVPKKKSKPIAKRATRG